jgi:fatty acid desaturase
MTTDIEPVSQSKLHWYRVPIDRAVLAELNQRSDFWGFVQTLGHLSIIVGTGALSWYAAAHWSWPVLLLCLWLHGEVYAFLLNAFHEFCHNTVFKTRAINRFFLLFISFISGMSHVFFWASHQEHHKYTLHQPDDMEVILPVEITLKSFLLTSFINPQGFVQRYRDWVLLSMGQLQGDWMKTLFPDNKPARRAELITWARILLVGHTAIIAIGWYTGLWMIPVLITFAPFYGGVALFLCNNTQHVGLQDDVEDFRLCTRTIYINPLFQFLYWHMNFHIEHHMYAGVPCYKLARLHAAIKHELPYTPNGLLETWTTIIRIMRRQKAEPGYEYVPDLPTATPA